MKLSIAGLVLPIIFLGTTVSAIARAQVAPPDPIIVPVPVRPRPDPSPKPGHLAPNPPKKPHLARGVS